jgi:hypothetical protein
MRREGRDLPRIHEFITNCTKGKRIFFYFNFTNLERIVRRGKRIIFAFISRIETNYTKERGGTIENNLVIANEVKQSHKNKFRLLRLPVRVRTQTGYFTPRNYN